MIARGKFFAMEMVVDPATMTVDPSLSREEALEKMKGELQELCAAIQQSVVIQSENAFKKAKKIIVFDVESTLIPSQTIGTLLERVKEKVASVVPGANLDLSVEDKMQAFIEHVHLLKGLPVSELKSLGDTIRLNDNTVKLIRILKSMGFKIALLSSGFEFFLKKVFEGLQVDYAFSNSLKVDAAGILTGELEEPVLTSVTKNEILEFIMNVEKISRDQVVAVGDGSLRSHYIKGVGLSIAYKPQIDSVQTDGVLSGDQIVDMLYCLGIPKTEIDRYMEGQPDEP
jgi:phosphoserine phosphatase